MSAAAPASVLVVRLGSLGDLVHAVPAVAALRHAWPSARIDWLVEPAHAEFLRLVSIINNVIVLRGKSARGWMETRTELRARGYDVAVDLQGLIKSAALARLSGAARVCGFDRAALREASAHWFYTDAPVVGEGRHVIEKNLALVQAVIGDSPTDPPTALEFPLQVPESAAQKTLRRSVPGPYAVLNPGAAWPNKRWPIDSFAAVARWIATTHGWTPVVLWGPADEALADGIVTASEGVARKAPATTIADILAIAREARVFVSGDTGPLHLACAMGTPAVAMFGPTTPARNGPWDDRDVSISRYDSCPCHYERTCRQPDRWCLATIAVDDVTGAITRRVEGA